MIRAVNIKEDITSWSWKATLSFFLLWLLPPNLLRLMTILFLLPEKGPLFTIPNKVIGLILGLTQDLFISLGVLVLGLSAMFLLRRSLSVFATLNALLFVVLQSYIILDFMLFWKIGVRMNFQFIDYLMMAKDFKSSVQALDPRPLWLGLSIVLISIIPNYFYFSCRPLTLKPTILSFLIIFFLTSLAPVTTALTPRGIGYYVSNPIFNDMRTIALWGISELKQKREWTAPGYSPPPMQEYSRAEVFERISPEYSLLKKTLGFKGEKLFELRIEPGERPHVVFLFLESFRALDIGVLGGKYGVSPNFDNLSSQGILFTNFYANGVQTMRGKIASLFGILPRFSLDSVQSSDPDMPLIGMADLFKNLGYRTAYIHNGSLSFQGKVPFISNHTYDEVYGVEHLQSAFPDAYRTSWGIDDEYVMSYTVDWILRQDRIGMSSFLTVFTNTNHHPWEPPPGYESPEIEGCDDEEYVHFLETFSYIDRCLGLFWSLLKKNGLEKRIIVFILSDTAQPMGEHHNNHQLLNYLYEENVRIPLLIMAEGRIAEPKRIDDIGSEVDLLPTVMDIFQLSGLNHAMGTSLMRRVEDRAVFFNNPFSLGYWGMRKKDYKYIYCVDSQRQELYDLSKDSMELKNLAQAMPELSEIYHRQIIGTHLLFETLYEFKLFTKKMNN